ncbi:Patatin-like phospholipase [Yersinia rohdei]|uniref:patatin-like phospholipase family protein n=1 Tax=Yersinia rohdei TaxID=29485 RepID=UPI0005E2D049|nr:patatin-like phospholipase family protein [Yersinia rohdei]CNJ08034.1 Patatin-like phospholipase [Yersinia rohdei]
MNQTMKVGLALSGGGAIGAYEVGVVKALAESGTDVHMISGASIGALNGAIIASSSGLSQAAERMEEIWTHLGNGNVLSVNKSAYLSLLLQFGIGMGLSPMLSKTGCMLSTVLNRAALITGTKGFENQPLFSDQPLIDLMDRYLDMNALATGLPLFISLYPTEGGLQDIVNCIAAELGLGSTRDSEFYHVQNLPPEQQKEALLASAALPLLFKPREVNGTHYSDGGMGGWASLQGNTPVTPLVEAGCNIVIVTHLSDGSLWDRQVFPDTTVLEVRPQRSLRRNDGVLGCAKDLLGFTAMHIDSWIKQGYQDTMIAIDRIRKPLQTRRTLQASSTALESSLAGNTTVDSVLKNAMSRLK